jgi:hypothetical protein
VLFRSTTSGTHFLGTTDLQALELKVGNARALRLVPGTLSPSLIGGSAFNIAGGSNGVTIAGGGGNGSPNVVNVDFGSIGGGQSNSITGGSHGVIGGGGANTASNICTTVGGGWANNASGDSAVIAGGNSNNTVAMYSAILGGSANQITGGIYGAIGGGGSNQVSSNAASIGGGWANNASGDSAVIAGGNTNVASAPYSSVGGGQYNTTSGNASSIPGGLSNTAVGNYSLAAGRRAKANHAGAFVWADSTDADFASQAVNQFLIRAAGGVGINTSAPGAALEVAGQVKITGGAPGAGKILTSDATGLAAWTTPPPFPLTGSGTANYVTRWITNTSIGNGVIFDNGTNVGIGTTTPGARLDVNGAIVTNSQLVTNMATGSPPLKVTSTTNCPNLSADMLDGLHAASFWNTSGNAGTVDGTHFIGTTDNVALSLRVKNQRALRIEPNDNCPNLIGGHAANNSVFGSSNYGATVAGGGSGTSPNRATDYYCTVSGGLSNMAGNNDGTPANALYGTVGGGAANTASNICATVGGGWSNSASGDSSTVPGGNTNSASNSYASIGGGLNNTASGYASTIPGGRLNTAGALYSLASGYRAKANHQGAFVWADSSDVDFPSSGTNQFLIRASGGVGIGTNSPGAALDVNGSIRAGTNTSYKAMMGVHPSYGPSYAMWWMEGRDYSLLANGNDTMLNSTAGGNVYIRTGNTDRMIVRNSGNVGIGTISPSQRLDVNGNIKVLGSTSDGNIGIDLQIAGSPSGKGGRILLKAGNAPDFYSSNHWGGDVDIVAGGGYNNSGGNVSIQGGSTSVWSMSTVPTQVQILGGNTDADTTPSAFINVEGGANLDGDGSWNQNGGNIVLMPGAHLGTGSDGNVGIGTSEPTAKLHVAGNASVTGALKVGGGSAAIAYVDSMAFGAGALALGPNLFAVPFALPGDTILVGVTPSATPIPAANAWSGYCGTAGQVWINVSGSAGVGYTSLRITVIRPQP